MPLFGGARDISLIRTMNRELINDIIQTEIAYYKLELDQTITNVYGESNKKILLRTCKDFLLNRKR